MIRSARRLAARLRRIRSMDDDLNRRVYVETRLIAIYEGQRDLPTREECREWAVKLGVPSAYSQSQGSD